MARRALLLVIAIVALFTLSGCTGGGSAVLSVDRAAVMAAVGKAVGEFEKAIEDYDVDGMLGCLSESGFRLTLREGGFEYIKPYSVLEGELRADEEAQVLWRKPAPEGHGYKLDLKLGEQTFSSITATGAIMTQPYEVWESASEIGIGPLKTDNGTITWHFAKISGAWKAMAMTITFEPLRHDVQGAVMRKAEPAGFGFGVGFGGLKPVR